MSVTTILFYSFAYLGALFGIAFFANQRANKGKSVITPSVYALSLAVYCTAWTYYGSVGRAVKSGMDYILIYLGPTLMTPLWWLVLRKIIRICKVQRITSIADFISSRYGKSALLGVLVSFFCIIGIVPYIALQIKAIALSVEMLAVQDFKITEVGSGGVFFYDSSFYITIGLAVFTILYGVRKMDVTERHEGMVAAIAFESVWKLIAFLVVGVVITYSFFDSFGDIFNQAGAYEHLREKFTLQTSSDSWFWMLFISMAAVLLLPRQFQVAVVENTDETHLSRAMWLFPLYLLLINLFVFPIAFGGEILLDGEQANPDMYVLSLPLAKGKIGLAILAYLGGLSAATGMIIVSSIALSIMASNNLIIPILLRLGWLNQWSPQFNQILKYTRWGSIVAILLAAYGYCVGIAFKESLVSIGLVSFAAVAQFIPAMIGGLFWKTANRRGAVWGMVGGFCIWFYTLVLPSIISAGLLPYSIIEEGLFGIELLKPFALFGLEDMDYIPHAMFWSMLVNGGLFIGLSMLSKPSRLERQQAKIFVDVFKLSVRYEDSVVWKGTAYIPDIQSLLSNFLGEERALARLKAFKQRFATEWEQDGKAHPRLVAYAENVLAGIIGTASARIVVSSVAKEEQIEMDKVVNILKESQQILGLNKELQKTSDELREVTEQLRLANSELKEQDELKDEFLYTVTHELRTPLTSIRAIAEILQDHHETMEVAESEEFLGTIVKEAERLTRLISQVLDLEKFDSGTQELERSEYILNAIIEEASEACQQLLADSKVKLQLDLGSIPPLPFDKDRMMQVFINLISNACKYCDPEHGQVRISTSLVNNELLIEVADNGKGIAPESLPHVFDKFYQARNQTRKKPKGTGLGLAITQKIIQLHGGNIAVASELGKGTMFTIRFGGQNELQA